MQRFFVSFLLFCLACCQLTNSLSLSMSAAKGKTVAILQTKGGGHGEIGYALAKALMGEHKVTIVQDSKYKKAQEPFNNYGSLASSGVTIVEKALSDVDDVTAFLSAGKWDLVIDNNSKDPEAAVKIASSIKSPNMMKTPQLFYISSGGMYTGNQPDGGYKEACCEVKEDNDCRKVEQALAACGAKVSVTNFRPQYIYGGNTNKRGNLDWFVDRIARGLPLPIPGDGSGSQLVALSHVEDVVNMLVSAIGSGKADKQTYNCGTDKFVSYRSVCEAVARAMGLPVSSINITGYDPKKLNKDLGKPSFPFRATTFVLNPTKAKTELNWPGAMHTLESDMGAWVAQYKAAGLDTAEFFEDAAITALGA